MVERFATMLGLWLLVLSQGSCAGTAGDTRALPAHAEQAVMYVQTSGSVHPPEKPVSGGGVWVRANAAQATGIEEVLVVVKGALLERGFEIVEREQLPLLLEEQRTQLQYGDDRQGDQISVGKMVGARLVAFVEMDSRPATGYWEGYHLAVSVRLVGVESGAVHFLGTARWSQPAPSATYGLETLAARAVTRAFCAPERWEEAAAGNGWNGTCHE